MSERTWFNPRFELYETGTDWETAARLLSVFGHYDQRTDTWEGYSIRLTWRVRDPILQVVTGTTEVRDAVIVDTLHIYDGQHPHAIDGQTGGILVRDADDDGAPTGDPWFLAYEDIEAIGLY